MIHWDTILYIFLGNIMSIVGIILADIVFDKFHKE